MNTGKRVFTTSTTVLVVAVAMLCVMCGCDAKAIPGKVGTPLQNQEKIIAKDPKLYNDLRIVNHKAERTDNDLLQVRLAIENIDDDDVWCDIQVVFYDKDGFELENTTYQPLLLLGEQITFYKTVSLSAQAYDYTVMLRNARETKGIK